jgi:integrase
LCPVNGHGSLNKSARKRRARQIVAESGADSPECLAKADSLKLGLTFREQAEFWIERIRARSRKPVKLATRHGYRHLLDRWILQRLGNLPLCEVKNSTVKPLVSEMVALGKSPKTIQLVVGVVRLVVASYVGEDGEPVFKPTWNPDYMDLPIVEKRNQRRPAYTGEEVTHILSLAEGRFRVLFALAAGSGARIAELLGLEVGKHVSAEGSILTVGQSVWRHGEVQTPKTASAYREVDLHPLLAAMLRDYIGERRDGFLFPTESGRPLSQRNALRALHLALTAAGLERRGFHPLRRFRQTLLRKNRAPEDLIRYWLGWSSKSIADEYSRVQDDLVFRKGVAESMGLGFEVPCSNPASVPNCTLREVVSEVV